MDINNHGKELELLESVGQKLELLESVGKKLKLLVFGKKPKLR